MYFQLYIYIKSTSLHSNLKIKSVSVSTTTGLATLLGVFSLALCFISLPWNLLNNICTLLSGGRSTLPCTNIGALFIVHILGHSCRNIVANLLRDIIAHLARLVHIIAYLFGNWLANVLLVCGALTVRDFLGVDLRDKGAGTSCLLLAVP